jgi:hypothetical protein
MDGTRNPLTSPRRDREGDSIMPLPDDVDRYEQEFEDIDPKTIQIWQLAELSAIRQQLEIMNGVQSEDTTETYTCLSCQSEIPKDELQDHAENKHNAPPNSDPVELGLYDHE